MYRFFFFVCTRSNLLASTMEHFVVNRPLHEALILTESAASRLRLAKVLKSVEWHPFIGIDGIVR